MYISCTQCGKLMSRYCANAQSCFTEHDPYVPLKISCCDNQSRFPPRHEVDSSDSVGSHHAVAFPNANAAAPMSCLRQTAGKRAHMHTDKCQCDRCKEIADCSRVHAKDSHSGGDSHPAASSAQMQHEADVNAYITKYTSMRQHSVQDFLQENPELAPPKSPSSYGLDETTTKLKSTETLASGSSEGKEALLVRDNNAAHDARTSYRSTSEFMPPEATVSEQQLALRRLPQNVLKHSILQCSWTTAVCR